MADSSSSCSSDFSFSPRSYSSTTPSPASSSASSPSLSPYKHFEPVQDGFHLGDDAPSPAADAKPSPTQVSAYAASIIRNEAYALLALAARIAPAAQPIGDDSDEDLGWPVETAPPAQESKTNLAFSAVVQAINSLPPHGKIIVSGVGKSGIAGRKMVATFCSLGELGDRQRLHSHIHSHFYNHTGIQAVFLHPLEALHGDLGVICPCSPHNPCDAMLLISHSGATAELMRLLPIVRPRVRTLIAVTRDSDSVLARGCTNWLDAGTGAYVGPTKDGGMKVTDEADSALPAPTSSVVSALAIGDALALTLSKMRLGWHKDGKARRQEFLHCHPGGQLGIVVSLGMRTSASAEADPFLLAARP